MNLKPLSSLSLTASRTMRQTRRPLVRWMKQPKVQETGKTVLLGVVSAILKPLVFNEAYKHERKAFSPEERRLLFTQEVIRQAVSTTLWLGGMMASWALSKRFFKVGEFAHMTNALIGSSVLDVFVRPFLTAKVGAWFQPEKNLEVATKTSLPEQPVALTGPVMSAPGFRGDAYPAYPMGYGYSSRPRIF